jgi:spermidine synthase
MYRVVEDPVELSHRLLHGTTLHGAQPLDPRRKDEPSSYYTVDGPVGQAFGALPQLFVPTEIAVVGLGVGGLSAYARPGQTWTFYEIDPAVERIARDTRFFTYLERCGQQCRVILGDARLSLRSARPGQYSLIMLDAFSSDAIPMHLMTHEALLLYVSKLAADGIVAFHISNRHLHLSPIVARLASEAGLFALEQFYSPDPETRFLGGRGSRWVFMARQPDHLEALAQERRWKRPDLPDNVPLWTDDFSNILSAMTF